jgi:hypothetical protein
VTITVGRIGVATADGGDGTTLEDPFSYEMEGRSLAISGVARNMTTDVQAVFRRDQFLGLLGDDEPVVPVTSSAHPSLDGFYRVLSARADLRAATGKYRVDWALQLERATDWRQTRVEYPTAYGLRTNSHSITAYDVAVGVPGPTVDYTPPFTTDSNTTRAVAEGSSVVLVYDLAATSAGTTGTGRLIIAPADYYHGCARVEFNTEGSTWRHAVGRISFPASGKLRLTNGAVRCTVTYGSSAVSDLSVEWWDGSAWDTATEFYLEGVSVHGELTYYSAAVLRNTAEAVTVRFTCIPASLGDGAVTVDFTVRRGMRWVYCYVQSLTASTWRLGLSSAAGGTSITGGVRRTLNNGGGNREVLTGPTATTIDTGNTRVTTASASSASFGIGCEVAGSSAAGQSTAANQIDEYYAALDERGIVVAT